MIGIVFVFFACGGGKEGVSDRSEKEQIAKHKTTKAVTAPKLQTKQQVITPIFTFRIEPKAEYDITSGKNLKLIIEGNQNALVSFSWIKPDGKKIVEKQREITEKEYIRPLNSKTVKKYFGTGLKTITAKITYDKSRPPIELSKTIIIVEPTPKPKITKPVSDTVKTVLKPIQKVTIEKQVPKPDISFKKEKVAKAAEKKPVEIEQPILLKKLAFDDIFFDYGEWAAPSLTFNSNYFITLSKLVKALRSDKDIKVRLYGHTDSDGSQEYNKVLAEKRTITIGKLLLNLFPDEERESIAERIELIGIGKVEPLIKGVNKIRDILNRRVSIELTYDAIKGKTLADYLETEKTIVKKKVKPKPVKKAYKPKKAKSPQEKLYENAGKLFSQKRYAEAIATYGEIISFDPNNSLADNAQWWIGEALFYQRKYQDALSAYKKVFGLGDRNKEAYAQLRLGYCYLRLNQKENAIEEARKVTLNYPNAQEEIKKANRLLREMGSY